MKKNKKYIDPRYFLNEAQGFDSTDIVDFFIKLLNPLGFSYLKKEVFQGSNKEYVDFEAKYSPMQFVDVYEIVAEDIQTALIDKGIQTQLKLYDESHKIFQKQSHLTVNSINFFEIYGRISEQGLKFTIYCNRPWEENYVNLTVILELEG